MFLRISLPKTMRITPMMLASVLLAIALPAQQDGPAAGIDDFFRDFTAEWVRSNPNQATASRYFMGEEQDRLERQLTPETVEWQRADSAGPPRPGRAS